MKKINCNDKDRFMVDPKGDVSSGFTVLLGLMGLWMSDLNALFGEYQATINVMGVFGGLILTGWFYWRSDRQKTRDRELRHRRFEYEKERDRKQDDEGPLA